MKLLPTDKLGNKKSIETPAYTKLVDSWSQYSTWEVIWYIIKNAPDLIRAMWYIIKAKEMFKSDPNTTIMSIIKALIIIAGLFGVNIAPELQGLITTLCLSAYAVITVIMGYFTKDKPKA